MGRARGDCYRHIGYPLDFKFNKKFGNQNDPNVRGGDQRTKTGGDQRTETQAHFLKNDAGRN